MPVAIKLYEITPEDAAETSPEHGTSRTEWPKEPPCIFFSSALDDGKGPIVYSLADTSDAPLYPRQNGLAGAVIDAHNHCRPLVLRPEDIWLAILSQMSFYVNRNAESLFSLFFTRSVQEPASVTPTAVSGAMDVDSMMQSLLDHVSQNFVDPGLNDWIVPNFSKTTAADKTAARITFLAASTVRSTWDEYKDLKESSVCGIPSVTLLGDKTDWQEIQRRLEKFASWGEQAWEFAETLFVVLSYFVMSFDRPYSDDVGDFWCRMATEIYRQDGAVRLCGWIESFFYWRESGEPIPKVRSNLSSGWEGVGSIMPDDIPPSASLVTNMVANNEGPYVASLIAGSIGYFSASPDLPGLLAGTHTEFYGKPEDAIQPSAGWFMYKNTWT